MQDAADEHAAGFRQEEDDVLAMLEPVQAGVDVVTHTSHTGHAVDTFQALNQVRKISIRLSLSPSIYGVTEDVLNIRFGIV
jgi:hypothetical protein